MHLKSGELYNLAEDIGEYVNIAEGHREIIAELERLAQECREDMGDSATGIIGKNCREKGFVKNFRPLTCFEPENPYMIALYD